MFPLSSHISKHFQALVENFFQTRIAGWGEGYVGQRTFLSIADVSHLTTPPHIPKHNGFFERHHQHIDEPVLALQSRASLTFFFWSYAFLTTTYLINHLPTFILGMISPYHKLFVSPNYHKL